MDVQIESSWKHKLSAEFDKLYFHEIVHFLKAEKAAGKTIYPAGKNIFNAFAFTPFNEVKVVILGQDPYHNLGQAHGLSFSVPEGVPPPPSLVNIFKEIESDFSTVLPRNGNLERWAKQGVLLLNAALTVEANQPNSHAKIGWHLFTDEVIRVISSDCENVVFLLWGKFGQQKYILIDETRHFVLKAAHPSPLSAYSGFFGCQHFSKTNEWLENHGLKKMNW